MKHVAHPRRSDAALSVGKNNHDKTHPPTIAPLEAEILHLQRLIGNHALQRMLKSHKTGKGVVTLRSEPRLQRVNIPGVDKSSDERLKKIYKELYDGSQTFMDRIHNVVTRLGRIKLTMPHADAAGRLAWYDPKDHEIFICSEVVNDGENVVPRTDEELSFSLLFELHNARKRVQKSMLNGDKEGYDVDNLQHGTVEAAGFALAKEWLEWRNAAELAIHVSAINQENSNYGLENSMLNEFAPDNSTAGDWLLFKKFLEVQVKGGHTNTYDDQSQHQDWAGWDILAIVEIKRESSLKLKLEEFYPSDPTQSPQLERKVNPFYPSLLRILKAI